MSPCPVRGCTRQIRGYAAKSQARYAAQLEPYIDMVNRLADVWDSHTSEERVEKFGAGDFAGLPSSEVRQMAEVGSSIEKRMHDFAHGNTPFGIPSPTDKEWRGLQNAVAPVCIGLALLDPDGCGEYWRQATGRGVKVPLDLRKGFKKLGLIG